MSNSSTGQDVVDVLNQYEDHYKAIDGLDTVIEQDIIAYVQNNNINLNGVDTTNLSQ